MECDLPRPEVVHVPSRTLPSGRVHPHIETVLGAASLKAFNGLLAVSEEGLRRELANQIRRVQAKHPERCATGPAPNMVLVEFLGSHDFAWAQIHKIERYRGQKDAPDGPTVSADEYHEAVNRLTG